MILNQIDLINNQSRPFGKKSWFAGVLRRRKPSLVNDIQSAPPVQQQQQNNKSKSWLFKSKAEADSTLVLNTAQYSNIRSAESDQAELLSTGSVDRNNKSNSIQFESRNLEYDDTIPIFFGKYSGSPMCTSILKNTQIVYFQLSAYNSFMILMKLLTIHGISGKSTTT